MSMTGNPHSAPWSTSDHSSTSPTSDAGRSTITAARWVVLAGAGIALVIGLAGGIFAVNPIALGIAMLLFAQVLNGKRWARNTLVAQQAFSAVLSFVLAMVAAAEEPVMIGVGLAIAISGLVAVFMLMDSDVSEYVGATRPR